MMYQLNRNALDKERLYIGMASIQVGVDFSFLLHTDIALQVDRYYE